MTPKEKAKELLDRYNYVVNGYVVSTFNVSITSLLSPTYIDDNTFEHPKKPLLSSWEEVKQEIEKL
jgi:hypothetical protein